MEGVGAGDIEARNIVPGDYVVISCSDMEDRCALELPNVHGGYVFITKVKKISVRDIVVGGDQDVTITGYFLYNANKDITTSFLIEKKVQNMRMETWDILDVFTGSEDEMFELSDENIADIEASYRKMKEHDGAA